MRNAKWQIDGTIASYDESRCRAEMNLSRPAAGLQLTLRDDSATHMQIFAVSFDDAKPIDASRIDAYTRGGDLVATYDEAPPARIRAQIYWRRLEPEEFSVAHGAAIVVALEQIVSVNTSLLDSNPQATISSIILPVPTVEQLSEDQKFIGSCVARLSSERFSYVELLHPADLGSSSVVLGDGAPPQLQTTHQLFQQRLEKGVILRARLRAAIVERAHDLDVAHAAYEQFAISEPPLTV